LSKMRIAPLIVGIILILLGLFLRLGVIQWLIDGVGLIALLSGLLMIVLGGASLLYGRLLSKAGGAAFLLGGIVLAFIGFMLRLWFVAWVVGIAGWFVLFIGIALTAIGVIGVMTAKSKSSSMDY